MNRRKNKTTKASISTTVSLDLALSSLNIKGTTSSREDIQTQLEAEFCPPLDPALIAALFADYPSQSTPSAIDTLRDTLQQLLPDEAINVVVQPENHVSPNDSSSSSSDLDGSNTNSASLSTDEFYSSPFGFLRAIFPRMPASVIESTLATAGWIKSATSASSTSSSASASGKSSISKDEDEGNLELNIEAAINALLSEEYIREITERGYVPGEEGDPALVAGLEGGGEVEDEDTRLEKGWEKAAKNNKQSNLLVSGNGNVDTNGLGPRKGKRIKASSVSSPRGTAASPVIGAVSSSSSKSITIPLFDVRQRQHALPQPKQASDPPHSSSSIGDPWVYFVSVAEQLAQLTQGSVGSTPMGYNQFLALFHDPSFETPAKALRARFAGLQRLSLSGSSSDSKSKSKSKPKSSVASITDEQIDNLLELVPHSDSITSFENVERDDRQDAKMCLFATSGRMEDAMDLMHLLRELDARRGSVVLHSLPPGAAGGSRQTQLPSSVSIGVDVFSAPSTSITSPASPTPRAAIPNSLPPSISPPTPEDSSTQTNAKTNAIGWQTVSPKKPRPNVERPSEGLAAFIPAYSAANQRARARAGNHGITSPGSPMAKLTVASPPQSPRKGVPAISAPPTFTGFGYHSTFGSTFGTGVFGMGGSKRKGVGSENVDAVRYRAKADALSVKRHEALRQASAHWQKGRHGGDVAFYYAQEARKYDAERRQWADEGARAQIQSQITQESNDGRTIDLHGLTKHEGILVSKERLDEWWTSSTAKGGVPTGSFEIITGVGRHSDGPGVLGPTVQRALEDAGWNVKRAYGKLVISGRRR